MHQMEADDGFCDSHSDPPVKQVLCDMDMPLSEIDIGHTCSDFLSSSLPCHNGPSSRPESIACLIWEQVCDLGEQSLAVWDQLDNAAKAISL